MKFYTRHSSFVFYALLMLGFAGLDVWAGTQVNLWILYCGPIALATWNLGRWAGMVLAVLASVLLVGTAVLWGHHYSSLAYLALASGSRAIVYFVLAALLGALRKQQIERVYLPPKRRG
jgi:hypothetical protein